PLPVTCYIMHQHTHNPHTSRLWEHGFYAINGPHEGVCLLGLASEGDVFAHGVRAADGGALAFGEWGYVQSPEEAARWAGGAAVHRPAVTECEAHTGWQQRTVILPCRLTLDRTDTRNATRIINAVLARGVSQDLSYQGWLDGIEEIARAEADHRNDDEAFWSRAPQLSGDWPANWKRGLVYDLETLRMVIRPSVGIIGHYFDGMQIQAPRLVLAEAAMDALFFSYADPELAAEVILGHFESVPRPNLPCMREDGSYNMVADDGQICGTAPEWGYPLWCCDQIWRRTGDRQWLRRLYPRAAAYVRWWLEQRRDAEGWLVYACSWESGQDVSSRFGPQQTGGTIIQHVRPVDLQASMAQCAAILAQWATQLAQWEAADSALDFTGEAATWRKIADEFIVRTRQMWQDGWFRDYDSHAQEWSSQQDTMHLSPIFCGAAGWGHIEQLRPHLANPPAHSGWAPLSWPPVLMTLAGAAAAAEMPVEAAELAYRFVDASYRSTDRRELDADGGLPGVTREYRQPVAAAQGNVSDYVNAGIEGYGWGALSVHLLLRYMLGLCEEDADTITIAPALPQALRRIGASYRAEPVQWGNYALGVECIVRDTEGFTLHLNCSKQAKKEIDTLDIQVPPPVVYTGEWEGKWGERRTFSLPQLTIENDHRP
ncbi:MAG TPA: trehalase family glycosidase, partial [Ktedonobacteraceae bacterium]